LAEQVDHQLTQCFGSLFEQAVHQVVGLLLLLLVKYVLSYLDGLVTGEAGLNAFDEGDNLRFVIGGVYFGQSKLFELREQILFFFFFQVVHQLAPFTLAGLNSFKQLCVLNT